MTIQESVFYGFSLLAILSGTMVIISKNSVRAVLCLVLTFFAMSGLWMLLEAEFLGVSLVLVYVGAVMVLFLFVVMMLDVDTASLREGFTRYLPVGLCVSVLVVIGLVTVVGGREFGLEALPSPVVHKGNVVSIRELGTLLYTEYLLPFELAGILLLVAIIAAISLSFRERRGNKAPDPSQQIAVNPQDRIRLIHLPSEGKQ